MSNYYVCTPLSIEFQNRKKDMACLARDWSEEKVEMRRQLRDIQQLPSKSADIAYTRSVELMDTTHWEGTRALRGPVERGASFQG